MHFIKIQKAYEILYNIKKRRKYDASLPFDESIPENWTLERVNTN